MLHTCAGNIWQAGPFIGGKNGTGNSACAIAEVLFQNYAPNDKALVGKERPRADVSAV